ncbi:MAG TPA: serine/threonine-protein kinase [Kofleriaceae bacterium]|nr:serine/threonine-protein kinase [Kofleriaceae bacterium]
MESARLRRTPPAAAAAAPPPPATTHPAQLPLPANPPSPAVACDVILDAAISADADTLWIEPRAPGDDRYTVSVERQGRIIATSTLDAHLGPAVVARLAFLTEIDLLARRAVAGRTVVRGPTASAEVVATIRPGRALRAEVFLRKMTPRAVPATPAKVDLTPGALVGQYRVIRHLGAGGMGSVYHVTHATLGRALALKVLHASVLSSDPDSAGRFLREARAAARIKHPNIVDVFDFGYLGDGRPYLVMELLGGHSLADLIDGPLEPKRVVLLARQLASALAMAHDCGVIHADLSPSNVLVEGDTAKLLDFGLAQLRDDPPPLDPSQPAEFVFGTPSYISPEQIRGLGADERSDQYSFGAVLYEMLTGRPPYKAKTIRDLCLKHIKAPIPEIDTPHGPLPAELTRVVQRCLEKRGEQRYPTMHDVVAALTEAEQSLVVRGWRRWLSQ